MAVDKRKHDDERGTELLATAMNLNQFIDLRKNLPNLKQPSLVETLALLARLQAEPK